VFLEIENKDNFMIAMKGNLPLNRAIPYKKPIQKAEHRKRECFYQKIDLPVAALTSLPNRRKLSVLNMIQAKRSVVLPIDFLRLLEDKASDYHSGESHKIDLIKNEFSDYILFGRLNGLAFEAGGSLAALLEGTDPEITVRVAIDVCHVLELGGELKPFIDLPDATVAILYEIILVLSDLIMQGKIFLEDLKIRDAISNALAVRLRPLPKMFGVQSSGVNVFGVDPEIELNPIIIRGILKTLVFMLQKGAPRRFSVLAEIWEMLHEVQGLNSSIKNYMRKEILGRAYLMIKDGYVAGVRKSVLKFTPVIYDLEYEDFSENLIAFLITIGEESLAQVIQGEFAERLKYL